MEAIRLQIIAILENSGLNNEQILFIARDIYKDADFAFNNWLKAEAERNREEVLANGNAESV